LTEQVLLLVIITTNCQWMMSFTKKCTCYWTEGLCGKSSTKCGILTFALLMTLAARKSNHGVFATASSSYKPIVCS